MKVEVIDETLRPQPLPVLEPQSYVVTWRDGSHRMVRASLLDVRDAAGVVVGYLDRDPNQTDVVLVISLAVLDSIIPLTDEEAAQYVAGDSERGQFETRRDDDVAVGLTDDDTDAPLTATRTADQAAVFVLARTLAEAEAIAAHHKVLAPWRHLTWAAQLEGHDNAQILVGEGWGEALGDGELALLYDALGQAVERGCVTQSADLPAALDTAAAGPAAGPVNAPYVPLLHRDEGTAGS